MWLFVSSSDEESLAKPDELPIIKLSRVFTNYQAASPPPSQSLPVENRESPAPPTEEQGDVDLPGTSSMQNSAVNVTIDLAESDSENSYSELVENRPSSPDTAQVRPPPPPSDAAMKWDRSQDTQDGPLFVIGAPRRASIDVIEIDD